MPYVAGTGRVSAKLVEGNGTLKTLLRIFRTWHDHSTQAERSTRDLLAFLGAGDIAEAPGTLSAGPEALSC